MVLYCVHRKLEINYILKMLHDTRKMVLFVSPRTQVDLTDNPLILPSGFVPSRVSSPSTRKRHRECLQFHQQTRCVSCGRAKVLLRRLLYEQCKVKHQFELQDAASERAA